MSGVGLVIVSHSQALAEGVVELASQMAKDVPLRAAGGMDDGAIGTSYQKIEDAVRSLRNQGHSVLILTDLGSATMTVEMLVEDADDEQILFQDAPLVEGAVAASVAAQMGDGLAEVAKAAAEAFSA